MPTVVSPLFVGLDLNSNALHDMDYPFLDMETGPPLSLSSYSIKSSAAPALGDLDEILTTPIDASTMNSVPRSLYIDEAASQGPNFFGLQDVSIMNQMLHQSCIPASSYQKHSSPSLRISEEPQYQAVGPQSLDHTNVIESLQELDSPIIDPRINPESLIIPMEFLKSALQVALENQQPADCEVFKSIFFFEDQYKKLDCVLDLARLQAQLDCLRYYGFQAAQNHLKSRLPGTHQGLRITKTSFKQNNLERATSQSENILQLGASGWYTCRNAKGVFRLKFCSQPLPWIQMAFIPNPVICTTAIFLTYRDYTLSIPPLLKTSNVVPYNSKIIRCVKNGDLQGVRKLLVSKKASIRDVDPRGRSILMVSINGLRCFISSNATHSTLKLPRASMSSNF